MCWPNFMSFSPIFVKIFQNSGSTDSHWFTFWTNVCCWLQTWLLLLKRTSIVIMYFLKIQIICTCISFGGAYRGCCNNTKTTIQFPFLFIDLHFFCIQGCNKILMHILRFWSHYCLYTIIDLRKKIINNMFRIISVIF